MSWIGRLMRVARAERGRVGEWVGGWAVSLKQAQEKVCRCTARGLDMEKPMESRN